MQVAEIPAFCPRCGVANQNQSLFCDACRLYLRDETMSVERATYNRRFWGDQLLEGLLFIVTLVIGWLIWLIFTSKTGQTPAKRLLNTYVINVRTGRSIGQGETWIREVLVKIVVINAINGALGAIRPFLGVAGLIDAVWIFFEKNRQTLHDKALNQIVVYAPAGLPESMQNPANAPVAFRPPVAAPSAGASWAAGSQPAPGAGGVTEAATQLRELARLRDEGIITAEEYEAKRAELVSRM